MNGERGAILSPRTEAPNVPTIINIPKAFMGHTLQEATVKVVLRRMNPDIHFDMGAALGIWHPYMETRQNVFYRGKSVVGMDRRTLPEVPIWSTTREMIEVPIEEVRPGEIWMERFAGIISRCQKCAAEWEQSYKPDVTSALACPLLCGNYGSAGDETLFIHRARPTLTAWVYRQVKDRVILVGWRHTLRGVLTAKVPGVTKKGLEEALAINLDAEVLDEHEVLESAERSILDQSLAVSA